MPWTCFARREFVGSNRRIPTELKKYLVGTETLEFHLETKKDERPTGKLTHVREGPVDSIRRLELGFVILRDYFRFQHRVVLFQILFTLFLRFERARAE